MADIQMPQLGETVTEGTITKWFKAVGDQVAEDEPLFEVSTDKVDSEVPSPAAGYLTEIKVNEGDTVDVGTVLAVLSDQPGGGGNGASAEPAAQEGAAEAEPAPPSGDGGTALEQEAAEQEQAEAQADAEQPGSAAATEVVPPAEPEPTSAPAPAAAPTGGDASGLVLSPVVRRLVAEHNLDPTSIEGTGAGGRITRSDVLRAVEGGAAAPAPTAPAAKAAPASAPAPTPSAVPQPAAQVATAKAGERDTVVPLNNIRKRTAEHMVRSKATSPHVFTIMEVDFEAVEKARRGHREEFKATEGFSLTYLPFIARAMVDALAEFPHMNATVGEGELIVHNYINIGVAVDLNYEGLIVPVIHDAQDKRLRAIAREVSDLANRARSKKLSADDISAARSPSRTPAAPARSPTCRSSTSRR